MKIYVSHSSQFNYQEELYKPFRSSEFNVKNGITLPHENSTENVVSKEYFDYCDLVIAEVSYPSTGMGIELGWANMKGVKIICIHKSGTTPSAATKAVSENFIEYSSFEDMFERLQVFL